MLVGFDTIEINLVLPKSVQNAMKPVPAPQLFSAKRGGGGVTHPPYDQPIHNQYKSLNLTMTAKVG